MTFKRTADGIDCTNQCKSKPDKISVWRAERTVPPSAIEPLAIVSCQKEGQGSYSVALGKWATPQWKDTQPGIFGHYKLVLQD